MEQMNNQKTLKELFNELQLREEYKREEEKMATNQLIEKHKNHKLSTRRATVQSPHYGYYHCETCNKFVSWIPKEVYYEEKYKQKCSDVMWFGKYQGTKLTDLPDSYLEWAIENITKGVDKLKQEYERRHSTT